MSESFHTRVTDESEQMAPAGSADFGHGKAVDVAHHGEIVTYNPDAPSEQWGWHGSWRESIAPRGSRLLLWLAPIGLILMAVFGNHESNVEDYWMFSLAGLTAVWLVAGETSIRKKRARRP